VHYAEGLSRLFQSGLTQRRRPLTSAMGNISPPSDKSAPCPLYPQSEVGRRIQVCIGCRFMSTRHSKRHHCASRTAPPQYVSVLHPWPRWTIFIGAGHSNGSRSGAKRSGEMWITGKGERDGSGEARRARLDSGAERRREAGAMTCSSGVAASRSGGT
jgi:hypothetical protein